MRRRTTAFATVVLASVATMTGYAAARSCADVNAETVELELVELTEDGRQTADRTAYAGATVKVHSKGATIGLVARTPAKFVWTEEPRRHAGS
jgi:hypothetical protein